MPLDPASHTILVSGATGQQGGAAARALLARGFSVRSLTRDPGSPAARALADRGARVVPGAFDDRASLDRALEGVHGAFSVQPFLPGALDAEEAWGKAFADAAADAGVAHFVYSSVGGAERNTGIPHFESKWAIEEHVRELGLPATILRPVFFMENWGGFQRDAILAGRIALPLSPDTRLQQVAVDDVGVFAALAFSDPERWMGRTPELAGDAPTMTDTAATLSRHLGREVTYEQIPWEAFAAAAGEELAAMYRWFEEEGYDSDLEALRREHPGLRSLDDFLAGGGWGEA